MGGEIKQAHIKSGPKQTGQTHGSIRTNSQRTTAGRKQETAETGHEITGLRFNTSLHKQHIYVDMKKAGKRLEIRVRTNAGF